MASFNYGPPGNIYPSVNSLTYANPPTGQQNYQPGAPQFQQGAPQYPPGAPQYPPGAQYPQGGPQYPPGAPQYPQSPPQYPSGAPQYQPGAPQFQAGAPSSFGYPYQAGQPPAAMSYPNVTPLAPTAPSAPSPGFAYPGYPGINPTPVGGQLIEWIPTNPNDAHALSDRAVVAGFEGYDGSPLWVIRARFDRDLVPGKLAVKHKAAYVAWGGNENAVRDIEVLCARPDKIRWVPSQDGVIPPNAISGGSTSSGEPLYIGRAREQGSLTPGKVHPSHKALYVSFAGQEIPHKTYEILCSV